jgi:hypothetical protein
MYSYVMEFNLGPHGKETQEYLADTVRTWPKLWGDIPGVTGTLLLCSAFALGGEFEYQWRVDFDTLGTLSRIEEAQKSDGWRMWRGEWLKARTAVRAQVSRHLAGNEAYCRYQKGKDGAIHFVFHSPSGESARSADRLHAVGSGSGVVSAQALRPVMGSAVSHEQTWMRLESLDSLNNVAALELGAGYGQLFGEIREVDGSFFVGA